MNPLSYITTADWCVLLAYVLFSSILGNYFRKNQSTTKDFFLGGQRIPWPAVSASFVATSISAITFVGVPAMVFAKNGNFTYLQFFIGALFARIALAYILLPEYYRHDIYSPYDYLERKLGGLIGRFTSVLFFVGALLGQGVRVYATGLVLQVMTGLSLELCITVIAIFSILWTWLGGIQAVIWTDVLQFFIFLIGGLITFFYVKDALNWDFAQLHQVFMESDKTTLFNFNWDFGTPFTFWAALIAIPFQNLAAFGTDQLITQRLLCCKDIKSAQKAVLWSTLGEFITLMMLTLGFMLVLFYNQFPLAPELQALVNEKSDRIFPLFILTQLPPVLKGLLMAGIFAAANSSMDSVLAALSQISVTTFYKPYINPKADNKKLIQVSRGFVLFWGVILSFVAYSCSFSKETLVHLAFSMTSYTYGPMLGLFFLALFKPQIQYYRLAIAIAISTVIILIINHPHWFAFLTGKQDPGALMAWPWLFPLGSIMIFVLTIIGSKPTLKDQS